MASGCVPRISAAPAAAAGIVKRCACCGGGGGVGMVWSSWLSTRSL
jgi:hypothetical protein